MRTPKAKNANPQPKVRTFKIQSQFDSTPLDTRHSGNTPEGQLAWKTRIYSRPASKYSTMDKLLIVRLDE